jgi:C-terminal processing protease CtpA/Prc
MRGAFHLAIHASLALEFKTAEGKKMPRMQLPNIPKQCRHRRVRLWLAIASALVLTVLAFLLWIAWIIPKPWHEGERGIGAECSQSFIGSPDLAPGVEVRVVAEGNKACGYAYAVQQEQQNGARYVLQLDRGTMKAGSSVLISLVSYDGWRRLDRVRRRIYSANDLAGMQLILDVSPRATLVEVIVAVRGGENYSIQGLKLLPSAREVNPGLRLYNEAMDVISINALRAGNLPSDYRSRWSPPVDASAGEARRAIRDVLRALNDRHSFLLDPVRLAEMPRREQARFKPARWRLLAPEIGYVDIPTFSGSDPELRTRYTASIAEALNAGTQAGVQAWVVDIRNNTGGNMWAMLAGLEPLLRNQALGWFQRRDGSQQAWRNDLTHNASQVIDLGHVPVAILTSGKTASSGEAVAIAFRGRPRTRSFGSPTHGISTGNVGYELNDGTVIQLTTSSFIDRTQRGSGLSIEPDERVWTLLSSEKAIGVASHWLNQELRRRHREHLSTSRSISD